jgi:hypothetical protein
VWFFCTQSWSIGENGRKSGPIRPRGWTKGGQKPPSSNDQDQLRKLVEAYSERLLMSAATPSAMGFRTSSLGRAVRIPSASSTMRRLTRLLSPTWRRGGSARHRNPMASVPALPKDVLSGLPTTSPIIDTGNYYPLRDGKIPEIESGMVESAWTSNVLERPVIKAFNNIVADSLLHKGLPNGSKNRIALPVSGDDDESVQITKQPTITRLNRLQSSR